MKQWRKLHPDPLTLRDNSLKQANQNLVKSYRLVISNQLTSLRQMSDWLDTTIREQGLSEELVFNFDLCANEVVTNIISYAYPGNGKHEITLQLTFENGSIRLEIEDDGITFNPLSRPEHSRPQSLDDAEIGGLGIDLVRSFMDECNYTRERDKNILRLTTNLDR